MKLLSPKTQTINVGPTKKLQKRIEFLENQLLVTQKDLVVASSTMKKMSEMMADIALIQKAHVEQTAVLQSEMDTLISSLFPKDDIKFDLMNEPYN